MGIQKVDTFVKMYKILKLFIPPIIVRAWLFFGKILNPKHRTIISTVGQIQKTCNNLIVVGNGPSLVDTLKEQKTEIANNDCIVVNQFCKTDYYIEIKPKYYLLADYAYFVNIDELTERLRTVVLDLVEAIVTKTNWDINLIVPNIAIGSWFLSEIQRNSFVHVYFYNICQVVNPTSIELKFKAWDENTCPPPNQTVLNTCVWLGIFLRYKQVFLVGADTSFMELLKVDQESNMVYTIDSHFYGEKKRIQLYTDVDGKIPQKLHVELNAIAQVLSNYWDLKYYADFVGVKVYNASKYSLIDAYERKKVIG